MLKVSKARVYLHKLASVARMMQLSRMMEKVAENTQQKPKGIDSGVDVTKGLGTASNSVNGQSVTSSPGTGGSLQNVTSVGNSNSAITGVGSGSEYNVAKPLPTSATGFYKNKGSNKVRTAALPAPGTTPSKRSVTPVAPQTDDNWDPMNVPGYRQWYEEEKNNAMQNMMRGWSQDTLEVPDLSNASPEVVAQWEQQIREARAAGRPVSSVNQPWGHFDASRLDPSRVAFWNENSSVPQQTAAGEYYDSDGRPIKDPYSSLGPTVRADEFARQNGIALTPAVAAVNPLVRSFTPGSQAAKSLNIPPNWAGFSQPGSSVINVDPSQPNLPYVMDHELRHDMVYNMNRMMRQPYLPLGPMPMSFQEAELPTTLGELSVYQQNPSDALLVGYNGRLYAPPSQFGYQGGNSNYGTVNGSDAATGTVMQAPPDVKQRFFPVTPLRNMVVPSQNGNGYQTVAGNELGIVGPMGVRNSNGRTYNPYLANMVHNVGQLPTAYAESHANRGNYFATQEVLQNAYSDLYAQSQPVGSNVDNGEIQRSPYTVQQLMRKATSGNLADYIEAHRYAGFLRPDLQGAIASAQGNTIVEKAKWLHDNAPSMQNVQAILNSSPENITPEMVEGQAKYSVTPGWDKATDIRDMATMGHAIDDLYAGTYYRDVVPQYLNQGEITDTLPSYSFSDPNDGPSITYVPQSETDKAQADQNALEEERIAEENAYGNHQMRARWVDPKTIPPHEREIPSFMRGISSSETPVTNAPSVDPPVASSAAAPDVAGVDSVNYDDSISFGHPTGAENYYRPDEDASSTSEVTDWTDYGEDDLSNLGSRFVDNSGSDVLDSNPYDPQAEQEYDPDQIYRDFGVDPNNRQPDGSLLPPLVLNKPATNTDEWTFSGSGPTSSITGARKELGGYRGSDDWDDGIDSQLNDLNNQMEAFGGDIVSGQDSEGDDPYAPVDPYSDTGLDSMEDSLSNLGSGFMDNSGSEALDSIPYASPDEMEYDTYGYAASQEEEPSFDQMMADEEARINSGAYDDLYGDYTQPSSSNGSGPSSLKPARDSSHRNTHVSNTSRRDRVSPSTSKPRDVGQVANSEGGASRSGSASYRTYQSGSVSYTQEDLDDFIATRSPDEQYRELEGDALVYAMAQRLPSECQKPFWKNRPPRDALSMYAQGPLAKAVMDGKITTAQAADLFNAFYEQMWHVKPDSMYSYEQKNGIETTPERMEILSNAKRAREQHSDEVAAARNAEFYNDSVLSYNPLGDEPLPGMPGAGNNDPRYTSNIPPRRSPPRSAY